MPGATEALLKFIGKDEVSNIAKGIGETLGGIFKSSAGFALTATGAFAAAGAAVLKLAADAAPLEGIRNAFQGITGDANTMLDALRQGSLGMVRDVDLMKSYNTAAQLVSKTFADQLPNAMQYLSKVSAATGQDMGFMIDSLVRGVGRMSPLILDNLGIQVNLAEATERASQMFGKQADELSKSEQQAGLMAVTMEKLRANTANMPDVTGSAAQQMAILRTTLQNLKDTVGLALLPVLTSLTGFLANLATKAFPLVADAASKLRDNLSIVVPVVGAMATVLMIQLVPALLTTATVAKATAAALLASWAPLAAPIVAVGIALTGLILISQHARAEFEQSTAAFQSQQQAILSTAKTYAEYSRQMESAISEHAKITASSKGVYGSQQALRAIVKMTESEWNSYQKRLELVRNAKVDLGAQAERLANNLKIAGGGLEYLGTTAETSAPKLRQLAIVSGEVGTTIIENIRSAFTGVASVIQSYYEQIAQAASQARIDDIRSQAEYNAERTRLIAEGNAEGLAELDKSFQKAKILRELDRKIALIQAQAKYQAELKEQIKAFAQKMAWWLVEQKEKLKLDSATIEAVLKGLAAGLGEEVALHAQTALNILKITEEKGKGIIDIERSVLGAVKQLQIDAAKAAEDASKKFTIDYSEIEKAVNEAYAQIATLSSEGIKTVGGATKEAAGSIAADIAGVLKGLFDDIAHIMETLSAELPSLPALTVGKWLKQLYDLSVEVGRWMVSSKGLGEFVAWFKKSMTPILEDWVEAIEPVSNLLSLLKSFMDAQSAKLLAARASVNQLMNYLRDFSQELEDWLYRNQSEIIMRIKDFEKFTKTLEAWGKALAPMQPLFSILKAAVEAATQKLEPAVTSTRDLMNYLRDFSQELEDWLYWNISELSMRVRDLKKYEDVLGDWAEALDPIAKILSLAKNLIDLAAAEIPEVETSVAKFFDNLMALMGQVYNYMARPEFRLDLVLKAWGDVTTEGSIAYMLDAWAKALQPLQALLSVAKGILDIAAAEAQEVKLAVDRFFDNLVLVMGQAYNYLSRPGFRLDLILEAWGDTETKGSVAYLLDRWVKALDPLQRLLSIAKGLLDIAAEEAKDVKLSVEVFFDNLGKILVAVEEYVTGPRASEIERLAAVFDPEGPIGKMMAEWAAALEPLSKLFAVANAVLGQVAESAVPVRVSVEKLFDKLKEIMYEVEAWVERSGEDFKANLAHFKETVAPVLETWAEGMKPLSDLLSIGVDIVQILSTKLEKTRISVVAMLNYLLALAYQVQDWVDRQGPTFAEDMAALKETIVPPLENLNAAMGEVKDSLDIMKAFSEYTKPEVKKTFDKAVLPALKESLEGLKNVQKLLAEKGQEPLTYEMAADYTAKIGQAMADGLLSKKEAITNAVEAVAHAGISTLAAHIGLAYDTGWDIGESAGQGIVDGLRSMEGAVAAAAASLADAATGAAESALEESSPSKIMQRIGKLAATGFYEGLQDFSIRGLPGGARPGGLGGYLTPELSGTVNLHLVLEGAAEGETQATIDLKRAKKSAQELYVRAGLRGNL